MGLVYEHWRPDSNECFYVGASLVGESRANKYDSRNPDYGKVLSELQERGLNPYTKLIWTDLEDDCTGTYEKIRISYQRSIVGKSLTNIGRGGFGIDLEWTEELKDRHKKGCLTAGSKPAVKQRRSKAQLAAQNKPEVNSKRSASLIEANKKPEVKSRRSEAARKAHSRPEVKLLREAREKTLELRVKRTASARLGGLAAGKKSSEELSERGRKAAETRRVNKLEKSNG